MKSLQELETTLKGMNNNKYVTDLALSIKLLNVVKRDVCELKNRRMTRTQSALAQATTMSAKRKHRE